MITIELQKIEQPECFGRSDKLDCLICGNFSYWFLSPVLVLKDRMVLGVLCGSCLLLDAEQQTNLVRARLVALRACTDALELVLANGLEAERHHAERLLRPDLDEVEDVDPRRADCEQQS